MEELKLLTRTVGTAMTQAIQKHKVPRPTYVELRYSWLPAWSIRSNKCLHLTAEVMIEFECRHSAVNSDVLPGGPNLHLHITDSCQE